jgi:hypothetical protein
MSHRQDQVNPRHLHGARGGGVGEFPIYCSIHYKKRLAIFPSPAGMSLTKLSLAGIIKLAGDGKIANLFLQCMRLRWAGLGSIRQSEQYEYAKYDI